MSLRQYLTVLRARWLIVVAGVLLGVLTAWGLTVLGSPQYSTSVTMFVVAGPGDPPSTSYERAQIAQQRVTSYAELATDDRVTSRVVNDLGLASTPDDLAARVEATGIADSVLVRITYRDADPVRAVAVVDDVARRLIEVVDDLERAPGATTSSVGVRLVQPAVVPVAPDRTPTTTMLLLGAVAGLLIGGIGAVAREIADSRIRSGGTFERILRAPLLGTVPRAAATAALSFRAGEEEDPARAESLRSLRTELRHRSATPGPRSVLVTSTRDRTSASAIAVDLAGALAAAGSRVLLVDADLHHPGIADAVGVAPSSGLAAVLQGAQDAATALTRCDALEVDVLPAGTPPPSGAAELVDSTTMDDLLDRWRIEYDTVLVVGPPLLEAAETVALATRVDGVLLVCRWNTVPAREVEQAATRLAAVSTTVLGGIFTVDRRRAPALGSVVQTDAEPVDAEPVDAEPVDAEPVAVDLRRNGHAAATRVGSG